MHQYSGNLSVWVPKDSRSIVLIGQDESTYHQYIFSSEQWKGPAGRNFIQPKGVEKILMLSGFQARESGLGLGCILTNDVRSTVNDTRKGQTYKAENNAMLVYKSVLKKYITDDPLLRYFRAGMIREGCWNNSHIKLQLEDCVDFLEYLFPSFDFVFLFDQS